jgi:type I restriction-modification system DNA methylase subunit
VQLIDASGFWQKMRKSLGSKRKELSPEHIEEITRLFGECKEVYVDPETRKPLSRKALAAGAPARRKALAAEAPAVPISRIFKNEDFGYRTITVERPLRDEKGKIVKATKGKLKGKPQPTPTCATPRTCRWARTSRRTSSAKCCRTPRCLDRPRQDEGRLRDPVQPPLLRLQAAAPELAEIDADLKASPTAS